MVKCVLNCNGHPLHMCTVAKKYNVFNCNGSSMMCMCFSCYTWSTVEMVLQKTRTGGEGVVLSVSSSLLGFW